MTTGVVVIVGRRKREMEGTEGRPGYIVVKAK